MRESLLLRQRLLGEQHPVVAQSLSNLAGVYVLQRRFDQAEPLLQRAMGTLQSHHGPLHDDVASAMEQYVELLQESGRNDEAGNYESRIDNIRGRGCHVLDDLL